MPDDQTMSGARRAYEAKRAAKAGKSLETWLNDKRRRQADLAKPAAPPAPAKKPGFLARMLDRAHKPL